MISTDYKEINDLKDLPAEIHPTSVRINAQQLGRFRFADVYHLITRFTYFTLQFLRDLDQAISI